MLMWSRRRVLALIAASAASLVLVAAGCGGDDDDSDGAADATTEQVEPTTTEEATTAEDATTAADTEAAPAEATVVDIPVADEGLAYAVTEVTAPAGEITLSSVNEQAVPHNIAIDEPETTLGEVVTDGGVSEITVELEPGTYEYYCSVPGHREAGMVGTLTVE